METTHTNHFVPQAYLRNWADEAGKIWTYRLLVSNDDVPTWSRRSVASVAYARDLYTTIQDDRDSDDFEKWIESEFETPGLRAIERVVKGKSLSTRDWRHLVRFAAAQDLRTPLQFLESAARWEEEIPRLMEETAKEAAEVLGGKSPRPSKVEDESPTDTFEDFIKISVEPVGDGESGELRIRAHMLAGRKLWLRDQQHLLSKFSDFFCSHKWAIAEPHGTICWPTSDHPVVRLNYYGNGEFDMKGGWGVERGNVLMPLSPRYLLITEIGVDLDSRLQLTQAQTALLYRVLTARAHRMLFASQKDPLIEQLRPRIVSTSQFKREQDFWASWHPQQSEAEREFGSQD